MEDPPENESRAPQVHRPRRPRLSNVELLVRVLVVLIIAYVVTSNTAVAFAITTVAGVIAVVANHNP